MPKGFLPSEDTGQIFAPTEAAQGISFDDMVRHQQAAAAIVGEEPERRRIHVVGGRRRRQITGRFFMRLKPRDQRVSAHELVAAAAPETWPRCRVSPCIRRTAADPHRRTIKQEPVSVHAARAGYCRSCTSAAQRSAGQDCDACPACRTSTSDLQIEESAGQRGDRSRQGVDARRHAAARSRTRSVQRLRSAAGVDDLRAEQRSTA